MKIALDAAKALAFLHSDEVEVIYGDFKTSKLLIDDVKLQCKIIRFRVGKEISEDHPIDLEMLYMDTLYIAPKILDREGQYSPREAMKVAQIVNKCLSDMPTCRPNMDEVVRLLELLQDSKDTFGGMDNPQSLQ
ncbi:hypothetical protein TSUD_122520 [Trifolium subterraneum]|nr:hypothetical protein TSUD_122520 [Trifolium subterraneum]